MTYIDLATVNDIYQAHFLTQALEEEGIRCIEANGNIATILPHLRQGIQIRVKNTDYLKARVICDRIEQMWRLRCPECDSTRLKYVGEEPQSLTAIEKFLSFFHIPVSKYLLVYNCTDCGTTFKTN
jgi:hypothetical protein